MGEPDPEGQTRGIEKLIKEYNRIAKDPLAEKNVWEYHVFKRYTTSKKDHAPHTRLVFNVRRPFPIQIRPTVPETFMGHRLYKREIDLGETSRVHGSILTPDYWTYRGEETTLEEAEALISIEMEKVDRFFQAGWGDMQYCHLLPYRKPVSTVPVIQDVATGDVCPTLEQVFCPQFSTIESSSRANKEAVRKIKEKLLPILHHRTNANLVHLARSLIVQRKKWVPVTIDTNPYTSELSHFLFSSYHHLPVSEVHTVEAPAIERLCAEMVQWSLKDWEPKRKLLDLLRKVTVKGVPVSDILESLDSDRPYTNICKTICLIPINTVIQVRETKFVIMNRDAERINREVERIFGAIKNRHKYQLFKGKFQVYFTWRHTRGVITGEDRTISCIQISAEPGDYLLPVILDSLFYTASIEPGFELAFDQYVEPKHAFSHFFEHHTGNPIAVYRTLGVAPSGHLANSFHWEIKSEGFLRKVRRLEASVQPYCASAARHTVNERLEVFQNTGASLYKIIDPQELLIPKTPLPLGLDATGTELVDIITNPLVKAKTMWTRLITDPERCKKLVASAVTGAPDPFQKTIQQTLPPKSRTGNKRRLEEILEDPDWNSNPEKRFRAAFDASLIIASSNRKRRAEGDPVSRVSMPSLGDSLSYDMKSGLVISTGNKIRVMSTIVCDVGRPPLEDFVYTGVYTEKPSGMEISTLDEAKKMGLKRVCLFQHNRYYVLEEKKTLWSAAENIRTTIETQQGLVRSTKVEKELKWVSLPGTSKD
ncbi:polymerase sub-unit PB2 [Thailand tick thogotovirus]|uniref:Polymerase sub-unit PB2 n=1 Tax=Thailand tick thogotovirus TaxID=2654565 RepID=A0A5P8N5V8_9ORTO|nr:polymerase sub-unit PB2 [Thailand tick thogotovirus]QFR36187.1 polymerase sub-unit PB2 [Thailand tick thogotovirus]